MDSRGVTIYDIAKELNVSPATVSRALRDLGVSKTIKNKVKALAAERGYRPNPFATNLRKSKMPILGIIVPGINSPLFSLIVDRVEQVAGENGFSVIVSQSRNDLTREAELAKRMYQVGVTGLAVWPATSPTSKHPFDNFLKHNIPLVFLDCKFAGMGSKVVVNYFNAGYMATSHLVERGCRRIAFIGEIAPGVIHSETLMGYREALGGSCITADETLIIRNETLRAVEGYSSIKRLLDHESPPDAVFVDNDEATSGVIQYAMEKGMIPEDLLIVGFNRDRAFLKLNPHVSSIIFPAAEMGGIAAQELVDQVLTNAVSAKTIVLEPNLIVGQASLRRLETKAEMNSASV
jgi:LacI family transcriptional regulator